MFPDVTIYPFFFHIFGKGRVRRIRVRCLTKKHQFHSISWILRNNIPWKLTVQITETSSQFLSLGVTLSEVTKRTPSTTIEKLNQYHWQSESQNYKIWHLTRISEICSRGLVGLSSHTSLVLGPMADATSFRSLVFTRLQKQELTSHH